MILEFHIPFQHVGKIDKENGIIHGVSMITGGIKARGHDLEVDDTTLQQLFDCAARMKKVPVKWNHKTGADAVNGHLTNFWIDAATNRVRGDWHLLKKHPQFAHAMELAETMPECVGLSAAFVPPEKLAKADEGKARCEELVSVDLVAQPAANPGGLLSDPRFDNIIETDPKFADFVIRFFEESMSRRGIKVDRGADGNSMAAKNNSTANAAAAGASTAAATAEPTLAEVLALLKTQGEQITKLNERFEAQAQAADEPDLLALADMTDEQLIAQGFDPAKVDAALQDAIANGEITVDGNGNGTANGGANGKTAGANGANGANGNGANASAAAAAGETATALNDLRTRIQYFETKEKREQLIAEKREEESLMHAFQVMEAKVTELAARNDALELALKSGSGGAASPGTEVEFDRETGKPVTFETLANREFQKLMKTGKISELSAKAQAMEWAIKRHPAAYREFRASDRRSKPIEFSVPQ